jgi:hypothetical protein
VSILPSEVFSGRGGVFRGEFVASLGECKEFDTEEERIMKTKVFWFALQLITLAIAAGWDGRDWLCTTPPLQD